MVPRKSMGAYIEQPYVRAFVVQNGGNADDATVSFKTLLFMFQSANGRTGH
jgi:hypothetical protein